MPIAGLVRGVDTEKFIENRSMGTSILSGSPSILAFAGSTRKASLNERLVKFAAGAARECGIRVDFVRLGDYPLPLYDADLEAEQGLPKNARTLKHLLLSHQGFLIASPEYNSSISAVLKNSIDWASRREQDEAPLACFKHKVVGLMSASPGALGGLRGLVHVRAIFGSLGSLVIPEQAVVPSAHQAFDEQGRILDPLLQEKVEAVGIGVANLLRHLYPESE